ncbi:protein of unknown function (plasmid) [Agrobacterium pusense]|uniref:Uncharacterized protein n=1 Tax=Agrobacterium pusense TaxID=648995 RepID=U4Q7Z6_9HYPH|nr:protein of unknown function [Agrobacterium pusense]
MIHMSASRVSALAGNLRTIWTAPISYATLTKCIVCTLINEVVAHADDDSPPHSLA